MQKLSRFFKLVSVVCILLLVSTPMVLDAMNSDAMRSTATEKSCSVQLTDQETVETTGGVIFTATMIAILTIDAILIGGFMAAAAVMWDSGGSGCTCGC